MGEAGDLAGSEVEPTRAAEGSIWGAEKWFLGLFAIYVIGIVLLVKYVIALPELVERVAALGAWASLLFVLLYLMRGFIYFPGGAFLVASGVLFRPVQGSVIYLTAVLLSATLSHVLGRQMHARGWFPGMRRRVDEPSLRKRIREHGFRAVFVIHLLGLSFDIPNYLSGYLRLNYWRFLASVMAANGIVVGIFQGVMRVAGFER